MWDHSETTGNERVIMLRLASRADENGICTEGVDDLARVTGLKRRAVQGNLTRIKEKGELVRVGNEAGGRGNKAVYQLALGDLGKGASARAKGASGRPEKGARDDVKGAPERPERVHADDSTTRSSTSLVVGSSKNPVEEGESNGENSPTDDVVAAVLAAKRKVGSRRVTEAEARTAAAALAEFNGQADRDLVLSSEDWLRMIVGRIRERPELTPAQHERIVQSAFRFRWWEQRKDSDGKRGKARRVTPSVIYGSSRCFEEVLQDAIDEANGKASPDDKTDRSGKYGVIENRDVK